MLDTRSVALFSAQSRHGLPQSRHGAGKFPNGTAAQWQAQYVGSLRRRLCGRRSVLFPCKVKCRLVR